MIEQIQALRFDIEEVGKHVKASKKRFTWQLALKDKHHSIVLDFSFISGKVKITVDRKILLENELPSNVSFQYPFTLDGFALNVIQQGETFELRVNNKVFTHLYNQQKTNTEFRKYQEEVKDIKVDQRQFEKGDKKISLNIGAFGGMKKKQKKESTEGWNGGAMSFPSYFQGSTQGSQVEQKHQKQQIQVPKTNLLDDDGDNENKSKNQESTQQQQSIIDFSSPSTLPPFDFNLPQTTANTQTTHSAQNSIFQVTNPNPPPSQKDEFNTMQNLFQTMKVSDNIGTIDFFAQSQPIQQQVQQQPIIQQQPITQQIPAFQSISQPISQPTQNITSIPNPSDFNTMQMMFATNSQNISFPPPQQQLNFNLQQAPTSPATDHLNSMMNKQQPSFASNSHQQFATGMGSYGQFNAMGDLGSLGGINPQMFATTSNANAGFTKKTSQQAQPQLVFTKKVQSSDANLNAVFQSKPQPIQATNPPPAQITLNTTVAYPQVNSTAADLTNLDVNDFNTMQKLFQTNSIQFNPNPPAQVTAPITPPSVPPTNNLQFDLFANNSHPVSMNSMSGFPAKSSQINPATFGTMQPGFTAQGLDFLNMNKPPAPINKQTDSSSLL